MVRFRPRGERSSTPEEGVAGESVPIADRWPLGKRLGLEVVARDRDRVSSLCLCAYRQTAGVSDNLTLYGCRDACPVI